jgi:hypothetical protein
MTPGRPLLFVLLLVSFSITASLAFAADEKAEPQAASPQNLAADPALFAGNGAGEPVSDLFFLQDKPRLDFSAAAEQRRSAVLNDRDCYTMRMYKVKRKERFANGENGLRGYSTCELASNYQMRTAVAHVNNDSGSSPSQK